MSRAEDMRRHFDRGFALPVAAKSGAETDLLAVTIGGDPFAIRLAEVSGLYVDRPVTPAPSSEPSFLGLTGVRSMIIPVFDLAAMLGYPRASATRWFVVSQQLGFAFERFEGHLRVQTGAIARRTSTSSKDPGEVVSVDGHARSIANLATVVATVMKKEG